MFDQLQYRFLQQKQSKYLFREISFSPSVALHYKSFIDFINYNSFHLNLNHKLEMAKQPLIQNQSDEQYKPTRNFKPTLKKKKHQAVQTKPTNSSKWNSLQNQKFLYFIQQNTQWLLCPLKRKEQKVFLQLSKAIQTRTPDQCRSHHQKMIKHHNHLDGIIEHLNHKLFGIAIKHKELIKIQNQESSSDKNQRRQDFSSLETNLEIGGIEEEPVMEDIWDVFDQQIWVQKVYQKLEANQQFENN